MSEAFVRLLIDSLEQLDTMLESNYQENCEICLRRLEVLAEQAMASDYISLDSIDLIVKAKNILRRDVETDKEYFSYEAPREISGRRGRPRFCISEEQIHFFQGGSAYTYISLYIAGGKYFQLQV